MRMHKNILGGGHLLGTSGALLALLLGAMLFPVTPEAAFAEATTTKAALTIQPTLAVMLPSVVNLEIQPTAAGAVSSGSASLSISTNNETGYSLYLTTADDDNALRSINPDTTQSIAHLTEENVTVDKFSNNTWGYSLSRAAATESTIYQSVPTTESSAPQIITESPATDSLNLIFAAKVDSSLPSGIYMNTVTISVVTNPAAIPTLSQISDLQEMTPEICIKSAKNETARLKDTRDDKLYWVAKLADGNCWMTQNLDFNISEEGLTTENGLAAKSDLPDGMVWDSASEEPPKATTDDLLEVMGAASFDLGDYVKSNPTAYDQSCSSFSGDLGGSLCASAGWVNVGEDSGYAALTTIQSGQGSAGDGTYEVPVLDEQKKTYDAHYLVGNYYSFEAATAGTSANAASDSDAVGSICPKGWRLPSHGASDITNNDFYRLTIGTGVTTGVVLSKAPYYFVPSGYLMSPNFILSAGSTGQYISATATSNVLSEAYILDFNSDDLDPNAQSNNLNRYSVRCLARS